MSKKRVRIHGFIIVLFCFTVILFSQFTFPANRSIAGEVIFNLLGFTILFLGQILRISARAYKSENSFNGHSLIVDGPYGLVRHPMFLGAFLMGVGLIFLLCSFWVQIIFMFVFFLIYKRQIRLEEASLSRRFGQDYLSYQKKVPGFLPPLSFLLKDTTRYLPLKWRWFTRERNTMAVILIGLISVKVLRGIEYASAILVQSLVLFIIVFCMFLAFCCYLVKNNVHPKED